MTTDAITDQSTEARCNILVVGIGGGAINILDHIRRDWASAPVIAAVNTDATSLADCDIPLKLCIGKTVAKGMGTGGDAELGRLAANEDMDQLRALVGGYDLIILLAGLGGGTATGAAPVVARLAREEGALVLAYVTTPFEFEGLRRREEATGGIMALKEHADAVVCLPNQRLHTLLPEDTPLGDAFFFVDRMMAAGIRSLWTLLTRNNMLNLDFADLQSLVENSGNECCFGYGEGSGEQKTEEALATLLEGPMLEQGRVLANAGAMILNITGGPDLSLSELEIIHRRFKEAAKPGARISLGAAVLPGWNDRLALTVLAAEHWMPGPMDKTTAAASTAAAGKPDRSRRSRKEAGRQSELPLGQAAIGERGRFQDVAPTIYNGEDLDIPTYMRQKIRIPT